MGSAIVLGLLLTAWLDGAELVGVCKTKGILFVFDCELGFLFIIK
jgi:hypothetical protein